MAASGRYEGRLVHAGADDRWLVLRVDVDPLAPHSPVTNRVSGDVFLGGDPDGFTWRRFVGSWVIEQPEYVSRIPPFCIRGRAVFDVASEAAADVRIDIRPIVGDAMVATVTMTTAAASWVYLCPRVSDAWRDLTLHIDVVTSVASPPAVACDVVDAGEPANSRTLTIRSAFAEAGVNVAIAEGDEPVEEPPGHLWSDDDLADAMARHFQGADGAGPSCIAWGLLASRHVKADVVGVMFANASPHRQGFAVFRHHPVFKTLDSGAAAARRRYLHVWMHEIGHVLNLSDACIKGIPNDVLSWMTYENANADFWDRFPFQFHPRELVHLRHGGLRSVAIGGDAPFTARYLKASAGAGGALEWVDVQEDDRFG